MTCVHAVARGSDIFGRSCAVRPYRSLAAERHRADLLGRVHTYQVLRSLAFRSSAHPGINVPVECDVFDARAWIAMVSKKVRTLHLHAATIDLTASPAPALHASPARRSRHRSRHMLLSAQEHTRPAALGWRPPEEPLGRCAPPSRNGRGFPLREQARGNVHIRLPAGAALAEMGDRARLAVVTRDTALSRACLWLCAPLSHGTGAAPRQSSQHAWARG